MDQNAESFMIVEYIVVCILYHLMLEGKFEELFVWLGKL
jgi:hypothetical protein